MTREELEAAMLEIHLHGTFNHSMVADPAARIHAMAEPAWAEIERLRQQNKYGGAAE